MAAQEADLGVFFDTVVVCSVTGSIQAGMVPGFAKLEEDGARPRRDRPVVDRALAHLGGQPALNGYSALVS